MDKLMLAVAVVVAGVWVLRHLSAYNRRVCPKCKGTGTVKSWILFGRHRHGPGRFHRQHDDFDPDGWIA